MAFCDQMKNALQLGGLLVIQREQSVDE